MNARYNTNGTLDNTFADGVRSGYTVLHVGGPGADTFSRAHAIALQPDGKIVVAGTGGATTQPYSVMAARLNANGSIDTTFGASGYKPGSAVPGTGFHDLRVNDMALQSDGSIIVAGIDYWGNTGDTSHPMLMRFYGGNAVASVSSSITTTTLDAADATDDTDTALLLLLTESSLTPTKRK